MRISNLLLSSLIVIEINRRRFSTCSAYCDCWFTEGNGVVVQTYLIVCYCASNIRKCVNPDTCTRRRVVVQYFNITGVNSCYAAPHICRNNRIFAFYRRVSIFNNYQIVAVAERDIFSPAASLSMTATLPPSSLNHSSYRNYSTQVPLSR